MTRALVAGAALMAMAGQALAADIMYEPPVVEAPPVYEAPVETGNFGGWYIRGDVDYHFTGWRGGDYITYGAGVVEPGTNYFRTGALRPTFSAGVGVGYQINKYFRADLTGDYFFRTTFNGTTGDACGNICTEVGSMSAILLMANAYAHIGTWGRFSPYVGAGIGGARVSWGALQNTNAGVVTEHAGATNWRFAWAGMVGTTVCLTDKLDLDVGYRYTRIAGGRMFEYAPQAGPGFDRGFNVHEARAGLRYKFGAGKGNWNGGGCGKKHVEIPYEPEPVVPIYK
ncbi:MAG: porin family protein [Rhizobiaceae bacterium]|nr:porin family protein [Rhizobiaceae bacterium]